MKKIIKIVLIGITISALLYCLALLVIGYQYKDWLKFDSAIEKNDTLTMQSMIDNGYDVNCSFLKYLYGFDHLSNSIANIVQVTPQTVEFLLKNGANPNYLLKNKVPLTILATVLKQPERVRLLLKYGADMNAKSAETTLIDWAVAARQGEIIMMIPPEAITMGEMIRKSSVPLERVIRLYDTGKTDNRVLQYLIDNKIFTKEQIEETRKQLSKQ